MDETHSPKSAQSSGQHIFGAAVFGVFAIWTLFPAITSVHIEAFSAQLQSMAILLNSHGRQGLALADQAYPISTEFLFMTRSGLVDALQIVMKVFGQPGDILFRMLMIVSMATFAVSSLCVAKRWSKDSWMLLFGALLLTPGLVEIGFYFSDNLPSAALAMLALALVPRDGVSSLAGSLRWLGIGAIFAAAILVRCDAVLITPALFVCLRLNKPKFSDFVVRAAALAVAFVAVMGIAQAATPFQPLAALKLIQLFGRLQAVGLGEDRLHDVRLGFFGVLAPILIVAGVVVNCRKNDWRWILGLVVLPGLFYLAVIPRAYETRYYLLLGAPALLIHGAAGLRWIADQWTGKSKSILPSLVRPISLALGLFVFLGPVEINMLDGPRTAYGRLWSTIVWREWQQGVAGGMEKIDRVVASIQPGETLLAISTHFNPDDYLRLRLLQHGYDILPEREANRSFPGASEVFRKGNRTVAHVRSPDPYFLLSDLYRQPNYYTQAVQILWSLDAIPPPAYHRAVLLSFQDALPMFDPAFPNHRKDRKQWVNRFPEHAFIPQKAPTVDGDVDIEYLTSQQVEAVRKKAQAEVLGARKRARTWTPITTRADLRSKFAWQFATEP